MISRLVAASFAFTGLLMADRAFCAASATGTMPADSSAEDWPELFGETKLWTVHLRTTAARWATMEPSRSRPGNFGGPSRPGLGSRIAAIFAPQSRGPSTRPAAAPTTQELKRLAMEGERMPPNPFGFEYAYVGATFEFEDEVYRDVALRFKGNSSYSTAANVLKRPFKIDFDRFVDGQKFHSLSQINLHNNAYDPSLMRECLSYYVFHEAGVPASRTAWAMVYLTVDGKYDREYLGVYSIVEEVDKRFLKNRLKNNKGLLVKPEGMRGLPYQGEEWSSYERRLRPKTTATPETSRRMIEFIKLISRSDEKTFRKEIGSILAVDEFLRFVAANTLLANLDSFLGFGHNYYMYVNPEDNKVYFIPWDLNLSFGGYGAGSPEDLTELSISRPCATDNRLIDSLLAMEEHNRTYRAYLEKFTHTFFTPENLHGQIDAIQELFKKAETTAKAAGKVDRPLVPSRGGLWRAKPDMKTFVTQRVASVAAQLAGKSNGFQPSFFRRGMPGIWGGRPGAPSPLVRSILKGLDKTGDGKITQQEITAAAWKLYSDIDTARKGKIEESQLTEALSRILPPQQPGLFDQRTPASSIARAIFREADTNRDWELTLSELLLGADRAFTRSDTDKSGALDERELIDALNQLVPM